MADLEANNNGEAIITPSKTTPRNSRSFCLRNSNYMCCMGCFIFWGGVVGFLVYFWISLNSGYWYRRRSQIIMKPANESPSGGQQKVLINNPSCYNPPKIYAQQSLEISQPLLTLRLLFVHGEESIATSCFIPLHSRIWNILFSRNVTFGVKLADQTGSMVQPSAHYS